ncbi:MAG: hypothetical protein MZU97_05075 [Bacillus subtilis]|nr:hypothetical protein [Bacillus subtilis]
MPFGLIPTATDGCALVAAVLALHVVFVHSSTVLRSPVAIYPWLQLFGAAWRCP